MTSPNLFKAFQGVVKSIVEELEAQSLLPSGLDLTRVVVEPPRDASHGDLATNAAMVLGKPAGKPPRVVAELIAERLSARSDLGVVDVRIDGPGFINIRLEPAAWHASLADVLRAGERFGDSDSGGGRRVNVEYVSANPTGPLHVGHGRGTVVGDVLASLLAKAGWSVTKEYYINDAGAQVDVLGRAVYLRYCQAAGREIGEWPEGVYPGEYLIPVGQALLAERGEVFLDQPEAVWLPEVRLFAVDKMMDLIRADLAAMGVRHDVFSSERRLVEDGAVERVLADLESRDLIYTGTLEKPKGREVEDWEPRPQTLFRATQFGDDVDRPLKKSDGSGTYFANDIAYHWDKHRRGFDHQIDIWGADHGGYVKRMRAAVTAATGGAATLEVRLCQLVNLLDGGVPVKMSKRAGRFVTLRDVVDEVGAGVVRFVMLTRKSDAPLDFDLQAVVEQSKDNPVFYVQYAHARASSVLRHAAEARPEWDLSEAGLAAVPLASLTDEAELGLIKSLAGWPRIIEAAADAHEPHRIAFGLSDLAAGFHGVWNRGRDDAALRFIVEGDDATTQARLALVRAVKLVIGSGLTLLGVEPLEEMR